MFPLVDTKDPTAVASEVQAAFLGMFPDGDPLFVPRVFGWATEYFTGNHADYQAVDARYHDFEHTLQGTLCMARLLRARHRANGQPPLTARLCRLGIVAILLHDTGYLKKRDDLTGTGAKYTATHVHRSTEFAAQLLSDNGFSLPDIAAVKNMIQCTGVDAELSSIRFQDPLETIVGHALATGDLLGQMAADDYADKLPILYGEFAEAVRHSGGQTGAIGEFSDAPDLIRRTPAFWHRYVLPKLDRELGGLHRFLNDPFPDGPNWYRQRIEANVKQIQARLAAQ